MAPDPEGREEALDRAVRALARRDHSVSSLRERLERAGVPAAVQEDAVETLTRAGYLDDERFALEQWLTDCVERSLAELCERMRAVCA